MSFLSPPRVLRPWMAWIVLALPAALSWWWATRDPKARAEAEVAHTLAAAQASAQALEERFTRYRRLAADLAADPALPALLEAPAPAQAGAERQLTLVAKASGGSLDEVALYDNGGVLRLGWAYDAGVDDYRPLPASATPRLDLPFVQAALRAPRGATWVGASEAQDTAELAMKPGGAVLPAAHISVPLYGKDATPAGVLVLRARLRAEHILGPGNRDPWLILDEQRMVVFRPPTAADWVRYLPSAHRLQTFEEAFGQPLPGLGADSGALAVSRGLVCYRRVRMDHRRDWILVRPFAQEDLLGLSDETLTRIGGVWIFGLLFAGLGWWFLDRREVARQQEAQTQLLQATLNASRDLAIFATGPDGVIRLFSAGAERMLGFAAEEAVGRFTLKDFHVPEELTEASAALETSGTHPAVNLEGAPVERPGGRRTWTYRDVSDRHFPVFLSITPLKRRSGEAFGHVVVAQDARPVLERERRLEDAAREAREADRVKGTFLAVMSHEVRTPMNAIMGMVRLLKQTPLNTEQREIAEVGERAARNLLELLDGVLDYSKLEAGRMTLESMPFAPGALTHECAELWRLQAAAKGLAFSLAAADPVPIALGDPARLSQVLNNLLGNALKFTTAGGIAIRLDCERQGESLRLRWEVTDSGPGIAAEARERIFEPFTQADDETTRRHGGTGLGLALSRELAQLMGGTLVHADAPGGGSRFILEVTLPRAEATQA
jgi:PAS domain S-box-containing protein